jgi:hypothetical protein
MHIELTNNGNETFDIEVNDDDDVATLTLDREEATKLRDALNGMLGDSKKVRIEVA